MARKRGFLIAGGELNTERAADIVLDEFREAKIGRITLELPGPKAPKAENTAKQDIKPTDAKPEADGENADA